MNNIIRKAVMQRAHEMKRGPMSLRLRIAWTEMKAAMDSNARMQAADDAARLAKLEGQDAMGVAMAAMAALGDAARKQGYRSAL